LEKNNFLSPILSSSKVGLNEAVLLQQQQHEHQLQQQQQHEQHEHQQHRLVA
jgi:hypothetical protein